MMCRDFVLYGLLASFLGASYANFGTKDCATGFSEDATWGEDQTYDAVDANAAEFPNAASIRVVRWKCNCDKYVASTATTGDCMYESAKLESDGTNSATTVEFVQSLGYYNFNAWSPSPRTGKNKEETERRLYHFWSAHQTERTTDVQASEEELARRRERAKFGKLDDASELLQLKGGAGAGDPEAGCPAGYIYSPKDVNGAGKQWTSGPLTSMEAAQVCTDRADCTSYEWNQDGNENYKVGTYNGGSSNLKPGVRSDDTWVTCIKDVPTPPPTPAPPAPVGVCSSGPCTQNMVGDMTIATGSIMSSGGYINTGGPNDGRLHGTFHDGDPYPINHNCNDRCYIDESCTGTNDKYCADWTIPSGCDMLTATDLMTGFIDVQSRFKELASAAASACSSRSFDLMQFWSSSGMPSNGDLHQDVNAFNVPFHQKWNAYYLTVRENPETSIYNRFRVSAQVLSCTDGSVSSQVFSQGNQDSFTGFCGGQLSWSQADGIWRKIVGEIHLKKKLG